MSPADALLAPQLRRLLAELPMPPPAALEALEAPALARYLVALALTCPRAPRAAPASLAPPHDNGPPGTR